MDMSKRGKVLKSAFDSTTFDIDFSIHIDRIVGSASISPSGRDVVLASTDGLDIIDLDSPLSPPRHLRNGSPWLVADVQWSPFAARDYWVASTANQKVLVWNLNKQEDANGCVEHTLTAHQRAITDINFSAHHPDILATCAVDGHVHLWDLRRPKKPAITFTDWFGGATQVKCNRQDSHVLASSHDRWLRIWDDRKSSIPLRSINAHASKIYGLDWNRTRGTRIVTCSLDKTIKFWDYLNEFDEEERIIRTGFPVWRARHTPFGFGLLAMPQDAPGDLHLYSRQLPENMDNNNSNQAVKIFPSCVNTKVKEFLWRSRGGITENGIDNRDFQLISWGDDNNLRLQTLDSSILTSVGYVKGTLIPKGLKITRMGAAYKTFRVSENTAVKRKAPTITRAPKPMNCGFNMNTLQTGINKMYSKTTKSQMRATTRPGTIMKTKHIGSEEEKEQKQIDWMSGIKINRPRCNFSQKQSRHFSPLLPEFNGDSEWDRPESLHDEIIRIHNQLPMILFDDVDMERRKVVVSINGPWGCDDNSVYIKVTLIFPECYPEMESPVIQIENTSLVPNSTYTKLNNEIQQIASSFTTRGKGCLETVLRYLLGEQDYEASMFLNDITILDENFSFVEESSSDDESNCPVGVSTDALSPVSHNANVPLPRLCGALFSNTGKLVCFFSPPKDKVKSLLATIIGNNETRPREKPCYEKFGRLQNNNLSFEENSRSLTMASEGLSDSDDSEASDTSNSCDFDFSFQYGRPLFLRYMGDCARRPFRRGPATSDSQLSSEARTGTGTESWMARSKSILALYPVEEILPSKIELAKDYIVFGESSKICEHNAAIAEKHGYRELADVWKYIKIILCPETHLKYSGSNIKLLSLKSSKNMIKQNRSCGEFMYHDCRFKSLGKLSWGAHPLAGELIRDLFTYFEYQADVQMLAMLSCIFSETVRRNSMDMEPHMIQLQISSPTKTPVTLDHYSLDVSNIYDKTSTGSSIKTPKPSRIPSGNFSSVDFAPDSLIISPNPISYSCGDTPPLASAWTSLGRRNRKSQSLSASPERLGKSFRRVNSVGLASTFAASFSRFTSSSSSPPKPPLNRKKVSPVEQILSSLAPGGITWGSTTILGSSKEHERTICENSSDNQDEGKLSTICTGIKVVLKNQHLFNENSFSSNSPFIDSNNTLLYAHYRATYSRMLHSWNTPLSALEILKYNAFSAPDLPPKPTSTCSNPNSIREDYNDSKPRLGSEEINHKPGNQFLDITGFCIKHESRLEPLVNNLGGAVGRCKRCKTIQRQLRCTICLGPITSTYCPCLSCGCVNHLDCLATYHSGGNIFCPGGCDCDCTVKAGMGVVESWEVMMGSLLEQVTLSGEVDKKLGK